MSLRLKIEENYKTAIKNKNNNEINTLRLIKSAIKDKDIEWRVKNKEEGISESEIMSLLQSLIKQRKDSIDSFKQASRDDLIEIEKSEINIISEFLPKQKDQKDTEILIDKIISDNADKVKEYKSGKDKLFGFFVGQVMKVSEGKANPQLVNDILKKKLK